MSTIDEIERRGADIEQAEHDAMRTLAECLREMAIGLPEGSTLVYDFVKLAKYVDRFNSGANPAPAVTASIIIMVREASQRWSGGDGGER